MSSLMNIASYPKCTITLDNVKGYFENDDDVKGVIEIKTPIEGQTLNHDGIKISLIGLIGKTSHLLIPHYREYKPEHKLPLRWWYSNYCQTL